MFDIVNFIECELNLKLWVFDFVFLFIEIDDVVYIKYCLYFSVF